MTLIEQILAATEGSRGKYRRLLELAIEALRARG